MCVLSKRNRAVAIMHEILGFCGPKDSSLLFLDDDDEWMETKVEKQVKAIQKQGVDFVYCGMLVERNFDKATRKV